MQLSNEQEQAISKINDWMKDPDRQTFCLGGYAGTGKTTLLMHLINSLNDEPIVCAPTGKAAMVLDSKLDLSEGVKTIHKILYNPHQRDNFKLMELRSKIEKSPNDKRLQAQYKRLMANGNDVTFSLKELHEMRPGRIVIIDESSMVDSRISKDILQTGAKILFVGDPGQLPPVGTQGFFNDSPKDFVLQTIHRQALGSPVTMLAHAIRNNDPLPAATPQTRYVERGTLGTEDYLSAGKIICGKNYTRRKMNRFIRKQRGFIGNFPQKGESLICVKNFYKNKRCILVNGAEGEVTQAMHYDQDLDLYYCGVNVWGTNYTCDMYDYHFKAHYDKSAIPVDWDLRKDKYEFDFGYCITCHKSQGSEWDKIIIADDKFNETQESFRRKWLYTAITRAKNELIWIQ